MKSPLNRVKESSARFSPIRSPKSNIPSDRKVDAATFTKSSIRSLTDIAVRHASSYNSQEPQIEINETNKGQLKEGIITGTELQASVKADQENEQEKIEQSKEEAERARVAKDIEHLMTTVKGLSNYYRLIDKIGEGSFSTVYKAQDLRKNHYNNDDWEPQLLNSAENAFISPASTPTRDDAQSHQSPSKMLSDYVALKHIYHTSSPRRIANEIKILRQLKGSKCISPLITAFRQEDQIFVVMPYIQHDDFKKTFSEMNLTDIRYYMRSLVTGLKELHRYKILHRDVKPNNFLYNIRKRTGYLIDFGLAESENDCKALDQYVQKQAKKSPYNIYAQSIKQNANNENDPKPSTNNQKPALNTSTNKPTVVPSFASTISSTKSVSSTSSNNSAASGGGGPIRLNRRGRVAGYIRNDPRHSIRANRAGTRGFRAPEVLMRVTSQTCAIDIWAVGVILLCLFTGRYPFFLANEEAESIIEIAQIFGYKEVKEVAAKYNRYFSTNIPIQPNRMPLEKLCDILNRDRIETWNPEEFKKGIDFLNRCLDLDYHTRITAAEALEHDFLKL